MMTTDEFDAPAEEDVQPVDTPDAVADAPTSDPEPVPDEPAEEEKPNSNREAKYRVQLRETEAERDHLRATVEALQRAEVERIAGASIQKPNALWSADVELASLLDDSGRVDPRKVADATKEATQTLGLAATRGPGYVRGEGQVVGQPAAADPWKAAFK